MAKVIAIKCKGSRMAPLSSLEIVQGDLKELSKKNYEKLRQRIEEKGFDAPLFVWQNKILDGTQRFRVLGQMLKEGWELPGGMVPICDIDAVDLQEAKDRLLGYISQYGKLTTEGLHDFMADMDLSALDSLDLPDFDLEAFEGSDMKGWDEEESNRQTEELRPYKKVHVLLSFPPDVLAEIEEHLSRIVDHPQVEYEQGQN
jgi:hypothetical protein